MRFSLATLALTASGVAFAAPTLRKRADIDGTILNYALTLEHLEAAFYAQGLAKYSAAAFSKAGFESWVRLRVTEIASHEAEHVSFLEAGLKAAGVTPTAACSYKFPDTSPATFLAVSQILEGVGTSAYLGAAANITNPAYLTAAGSILTVEARHTSWIRSAANKGDGFPEPFDTPLDFNEAYTLASAFITSCPSTNPDLGVKAFPTLTLGTTGALKSGESIKLTYPSQKAGFAIFLSGLAQYPVKISASGETKIPAGLMGQVYVVIASKNATVTDDIVVAGPTIIEIPDAAYLASY